MTEPRERLRLAHEPAVRVGGTDVGVAQHLQRNLAIEPRIECRVHHAHRTRTDTVEHDVAADLDAAGKGRHRARLARRGA